jgi:uncharacterized membrane protein
LHRAFASALRERPGAAPRPGGRLGLIDVARGLAVAAMVVYHSAWDLSELRLIETDIREVPAWSLFARAIAASFLVLVGAGLVLAHGRTLRRNAFLRRLAVIAGAALAVTVATYFAVPDAYIFFGILHCIAVSSVLALPFLRASVPVVAAAAAFCVAAPRLVSAPALDLPVLAFLGLGTPVPTTNDFVPIFPWFGFVLCGVASMRLGRGLLQRLPERTGGFPAPLRVLAWAGRHSLLIYLLHQPLIFGAMSAWAEFVGRNPQAEAAPFRNRCETSCRDGGTGAGVCRATCVCAIDALKRADLWAGVVRDRLSAEERSRIGPLAQVCFERSRGDRP